MPTISIPKTEDEKQEEISVNDSPFSDMEMMEYFHKRTRAFLDVPNWICPVCGITNFGRNKYCPYCKDRKKIITERPPGTGAEEKWKRMGNL